MKPKHRATELPAPKFTDLEREAYQWLWDAGIRPWTVDLVTKKCQTEDETFPSVVDYARKCGWGK